MGGHHTTEAGHRDRDCPRCSVTNRHATTRRTAAQPRGLDLQDTLGNRGVLRLIQAKLAVGRPGDAYEQEADRVAETIMRMPDPSAGPPSLASASGPHIQRKCAACATEEEQEHLMAKEAPGRTPGGSPGLESRIRAIRGGGRPLPETTRSWFEPRFGRDFHDVRIHNDPEAAATAREINALAYTLGSDIVFGPGQFDPETESGRRLLAHELTHVVQQDGTEVHASGTSRAAVTKHTFEPQVQGMWRTTGATFHPSGWEMTSENGMALPIGVGSAWYGLAFGLAKAWQSLGWVYMSVGGQAQVQQMVSGHLTFEHDGTDSNILELTTMAEITGGAKAQDLQYAEGGAAVAGLIKVRTPDNPTPPSREMFSPIKQGGRSTATKVKVADVDVTIPIDGSIEVNIPLNGTDEGDLAPINDALVPPDIQEISGRIGQTTIVDVYLAAFITAAADIEQALVDEWGDVNYAQVMASYNLSSREFAPPTVLTPVTPPSGGTEAEALGNWPNTCCRCTIRNMPDEERRRHNCPDRVYASVSEGTSIGECQRRAKQTAPEPCRAYYGHCGWVNPTNCR